jgi:ATP phosphoribosyltransferase
VQIKIALPKGRLLAETAALLGAAEWGLSGYHEGMRSYYLKSDRFPSLSARVFHEKDIPIQVAVGNYDLGICGLDWVEELLAKYPTSALVKVKNLGYGEGTLYIAASDSETASSPEEMQAGRDIIRIASEYPNLAESFALNRRLKRFSIFSLWGAAEAYPPENADLILVAGRGDDGLSAYDLTPMGSALGFSAFLIANKASWETKDTSSLLAALNNKLPVTENHPSPVSTLRRSKKAARAASGEAMKDTIRLALPDGHQQLPTLELLNRAGIKIDDYPSAGVNCRPTVNLDGVATKVIRPQDMPLQVANGNFDLAITGRDWLREHLYQFPSSPATELLDLKFGGVKIVAVVSNDLPVKDVFDLRELNAGRAVPFRVASEYVNIADKYARDNHLGMYRVIPTWGASEAFVPEDADLLIENTQTGRTIARHNLKIIDTLFKSTACLIGARDGEYSPAKSQRIKAITEALQIAVENT